MLGKILIVDAIATNRIVLKVKLASAFYQVLQAGSLSEAVQLARTQSPDLIIAALTLPEEGCVADLCSALQQDARTRHIPVMALCATCQQVDRMHALEAGVADVLRKPYDDAWLMGRVRSLIRAHHASAEWRLRDDTSAAFEMAEPAAAFTHQPAILIVGADHARTQNWRRVLHPLVRARIDLTRGYDLAHSAPRNGAAPDAFVLIQPADPAHSASALRLISTLRANAETRHAAVLVLQTSPDGSTAAQALDLGADDVMIDGFDAAELALRLKSTLQRKRTDAQLRDTYRSGVRAAVYDPLTGLHNRRYAMPHLSRVEADAQGSGDPYAVMVADLDHFKRINDVYGHASGDAVLIEVARRLRAAMRNADLVARIGGEEFMIVMPDTGPNKAREIAVRICNDIGAQPFEVPGNPAPIPVTISIGMAIGDGGLPPSPGPDAHSILLDQADKALYSAKMRGRNRVNLSRPAA